MPFTSENRRTSGLYAMIRFGKKFLITVVQVYEWETVEYKLANSTPYTRKGRKQRKKRQEK